MLQERLTRDHYVLTRVFRRITRCVIRRVPTEPPLAHWTIEAELRPKGPTPQAL